MYPWVSTVSTDTGQDTGGEEIPFTGTVIRIRINLGFAGQTPTPI